MRVLGVMFFFGVLNVEKGIGGMLYFFGYVVDEEVIFVGVKVVVVVMID